MRSTLESSRNRHGVVEKFPRLEALIDTQKLAGKHINELTMDDADCSDQ